MLSLVTKKLGARSHSDVSVGTTAALLAPSNGNRKQVTFQNQGSAAVFLGTSSVTSSGSTVGYSLAPGASLVDDSSSDAWYGVVASGTAVVHVIAVA